MGCAEAEVITPFASNYTELNHIFLKRLHSLFFEFVFLQIQSQKKLVAPHVASVVGDYSIKVIQHLITDYSFKKVIVI